MSKRPEYNGPDSDVIVAEKSRISRGLIGALSLIGGGALGGFFHNEEKHREISRAREIVTQEKAGKNFRQLLEFESEDWKGRPSYTPKGRVKTAKNILAENPGIKGMWHGWSRSTKVIAGVIMGSLLVAPIVEYFVNRSALKKAERARDQFERLTAENEALREQAEIAQAETTKTKSFTATLGSERDAAEQTATNLRS